MFESNYNTIENCTVWDNFGVNIYMSDSRFGLLQRNLSYFTPNNLTQPYQDNQNAILCGDEGKIPPSSDNAVINNFAYGGDRVFYAGAAPMTRTIVAYNTFADAFSRIAASERSTVRFGSGTCTGGRFFNNVIQQTDATVQIAANGITSGLAVDHNNWHRIPIASMRGPGDVNSDPLLYEYGPMTPGDMLPDWFKLTASSPARGHGIASESTATTDYWESLRDDPPDMGGHEYEE